MQPTPSSLPPKYGAPISLKAAKRVMAAAEAEALAHQWPMVIAIVDSGGHLVMLHKLDQTQHGSVSVAQLKAETAVNFRRATKVFEETVAGAGIGLRFLSISNVCALEGGIPLSVEGEIVGAIGVSGMQSTQDAQVAAAGAAALQG
jgi:glc operon protein GlcG